MQTRHLVSPVVTDREATSAFKDGYEYCFWHYIEKKKVSSCGSYTGYATNVATTITATTKDVEKFLISIGKDPEKFLIKEGYCDQDDGNTGHWRS